MAVTDGVFGQDAVVTGGLAAGTCHVAASGYTVATGTGGQARGIGDVAEDGTDTVATDAGGRAEGIGDVAGGPDAVVT